MKDQLIEAIAQQRGIDSAYVDTWGKPTEVQNDTKARLLAAMGYPVNNEAQLLALAEEEYRQRWLRPLAPVKVVREGEPLRLELRLPLTQVNDPFHIELESESGDRQHQTLVPIDGRLIGADTFDELEYQAYEIEISAPLPPGYHRLLLRHQEALLTECSLIIAPPACYRQPQLEAGARLWGPSVQLYGLRSERNWGVGDFTDLGYLIEHIAACGGDFVGLNPIHALYPSVPENASPYSPSSRRWLNVLYIDVTAVPEFAEDPAAQAWLAEAPTQRRLAALRACDQVDYRGVTQLKLEALRQAFSRFEQPASSEPARRAAFDRFVEAGGESLQQQATFDALQADLYTQGLDAWGWPVWPQPYHRYDSPAVTNWRAEHRRAIRFYLYLQFLADEQLTWVDRLARERGMAIGLFRDLAVGVSEGGAEIWANGDLYCTGAAIGAPPDVLGPLGQNWGLPPMDPVALFDAQYRPFIDLLRANMTACGALRIDHVMSLLRLWWVPKGEDARTGAYLHYPIDDLLGILALESHRNRCTIIGEDLGTVPEGIFETLQASGIFSYRVFFFERAWDGGFISPADYPPQALATLTTHDLPTLRGFWNGDDLTLGHQLGLYPEPELLQQLMVQRQQTKQRILDSLHGHHAIHSALPRDASRVEMDKALNYAMQVHLARGAAQLLSLQLEDWLEMDKPVNVPGTSDEYPNWRRKLSANLEDIFADVDIKGLTAALTAARQKAAG